MDDNNKAFNYMVLLLAGCGGVYALQHITADMIGYAIIAAVAFCFLAIVWDSAYDAERLRADEELRQHLEDLYGKGRRIPKDK